MFKLHDELAYGRLAKPQQVGRSSHRPGAHYGPEGLYLPKVGPAPIHFRHSALNFMSLTLQAVPAPLATFKDPAWKRGCGWVTATSSASISGEPSQTVSWSATKE